jgi:hypothetical protein
MRPDIQISHTKNGRIKDWAAERGLTASEAYSQIIDAGLESLVAEAPTIDWGGLADTHDLSDREVQACQAIVDAAGRDGATKQQLLDDVYPDHHADESREWWWRKLVNDVLEDADVVVAENAKVVRVRE